MVIWAAMRFGDRIGSFEEKEVMFSLLWFGTKITIQKLIIEIEQFLIKTEVTDKIYRKDGLSDSM